MPKPWEQDPASWELVGAYRRLVGVDGHDGASMWLGARLDELAEVGMFGLVEGMGKSDDERATEGEVS